MGPWRQPYAGRSASLAIRKPKARRTPCVLRALPDGHWEIEFPDTVLRARLQHTWPCFAWLTLGFAVSDAAAPIPALQLTVFRHRSSAQAWRQLRVIAARHAAMPHRAVRPEIE